MGLWFCQPKPIGESNGCGQYATPFAAMVRAESSFSSSEVRPWRLSVEDAIVLCRVLWDCKVEAVG